MALFIKQDFAPPVFSRRWIAIKCRPNMLLRCRSHVICVLESGLLFREDCATVEQSAPAAEAVWQAVGGGYSGWLTTGERWLAVAAVTATIAAAPPSLSMSGRGACLRLCAYAGCVAGVRSTHRLMTRSCLPVLLVLMRDYTSLARRSMQCLKQYQIVHKDLGSMSALVDSALGILWQQQCALTSLMSRCSLALLDNMPWLYEQLNWDSLALVQERQQVEEAALWKIHHAFLVIQSTLLKHIAMAHFIPPQNSRNKYLNHNERLYWLHTQLLEHLYVELKDNYDALDRVYRLMKNIGPDQSKTTKMSGISQNDSWLYSEVHGGIARANIELKVALNKCTDLDIFLDNCAAHKQNLDVDILNKDIEGLIDDISLSLATVQSSQHKLEKMQSKFNPGKVKFNLKSALPDEQLSSAAILKIEDKEPETRDEVFYFVKTEEDEMSVEPMGDVMTAPGKKEMDATRVVLGELKRKLVKREDLMRQREKVALEKTMPEFIGKVLEFPRQMKAEETIVNNKHGYISKIKRCKIIPLHRMYLIQSYTRMKKEKAFKRFKKCVFSQKSYNSVSEIKNLILINVQGNVLPKLKQSQLKINFKAAVTVSADTTGEITVTKWVKRLNLKVEKDFSSGMSEGLSDVESSSTNNVNEAVNKKVNTQKKMFRNHLRAEYNYETVKNQDDNLQPLHEAKNENFVNIHHELSSSSDSDTLSEKNKRMSLLKDIRRHRVARKKNHPIKRLSVDRDMNSDVVDESLRPVEYSFGTGMAMASMFQNGLKLPNMGQEEVFVGDGEVSGDSGNDEDS